MYFYYNPKDSTVYMTKRVQHTEFFRRANDSADWKALDFESFKELRPLSESKKMKESDWKSHYFWELPYGEGYEFRKWLEINFHGRPSCFYVETVGGRNIRITCSYAHNEVNEPFLDCEACLSKNVLIQICDLIMRLYENTMED